MPVQTRIQLRQGTAAEWTAANPVLAVGEPGYETDSGRMKLGDGSSAWNDLKYLQIDKQQLHYRHTQGVSSDTWLITHNLGYYPAGIIVTDSGGTEHNGFEVNHLSVNQTTLTFSFAFGGIADLS